MTTDPYWFNRQRDRLINSYTKVIQKVSFLRPKEGAKHNLLEIFIAKNTAIFQRLFNEKNHRNRNICHRAIIIESFLQFSVIEFYCLKMVPAFLNFQPTSHHPQQYSCPSSLLRCRKVQKRQAMHEIIMIPLFLQKLCASWVPENLTTKTNVWEQHWRYPMRATSISTESLRVMRRDWQLQKLALFSDGRHL